MVNKKERSYLYNVKKSKIGITSPWKRVTFVVILQCLSTNRKSFETRLPLDASRVLRFL